MASALEKPDADWDRVKGVIQEVRNRENVALGAFDARALGRYVAGREDGQRADIERAAASDPNLARTLRVARTSVDAVRISRLFARGYSLLLSSSLGDAIVIYEELASLPQLSVTQRARAHFNAGVARGDLQELDEEVEHYEKVLAQKQSPPLLRAKSMNNLGVVRFKRNDADGERHYYKNALLEPDLPPWVRSKIKINLGLSYADTGHLFVAQSTFEDLLAGEAADEDRRTAAAELHWLNSRSRRSKRFAVKSHTDADSRIVADVAEGIPAV